MPLDTMPHFVIAPLADAVVNVPAPPSALPRGRGCGDVVTGLLGGVVFALALTSLEFIRQLCTHVIFLPFLRNEIEQKVNRLVKCHTRTLAEGGHSRVGFLCYWESLIHLARHPLISTFLQYSAKCIDCQLHSLTFPDLQGTISLYRKVERLHSLTLV